jgi:hypothetical protein
MVTMMLLPAGPLPSGGFKVGVAHPVVTAMFEQADRIANATPA